MRTKNSDSVMMYSGDLVVLIRAVRTGPGGYSMGFVRSDACLEGKVQLRPVDLDSDEALIEAARRVVRLTGCSGGSYHGEVLHVAFDRSEAVCDGAKPSPELASWGTLRSRAASRAASRGGRVR